MKKRSLIFGIALLVGMALIFSGCEQDSDDGGGETFTDIIANNPYPQTDSSDIDGKSYSNSLNIDSVVRNESTGVVTITLSGIMVDVRAAETSGTSGVTGTSSDAFWEYAYPYDGTFKPAAGKYGAFIFNGAFPDDAVSKAIAVKVTNDAFRYYSAATYNAAAPLTKPATQNEGGIHIPASGAASRWRLYNVGDIPNSDWLSAMLWSEANPKRIDLEIQVFPSFDANSTTYTVLHNIVIDYSNVTFCATPAEAATALAAALGTGAAASSTTVTVSSDLTIAANKTVSVFSGVTLSVSAGSTITNNGTITLGTGASLVLATASTTSVGKIAGTGAINAGKTLITGAWEAVGATSNPGTLTITSAATGATITADGTNATGLKASAAGAVITQNAGASNSLTIAANTTVALGGDGAKVGEIVLKGDTTAANRGKLALVGTITTGNASANVTAAVLSTDGTTTVTSSAYTKIGVANLVGDGTNAKVEPTNVANTDAAAAGKIVKLTGTTGATISAGASDGTISGATATAATT